MKSVYCVVRTGSLKKQFKLRL